MKQSAQLPRNPVRSNAGMRQVKTKSWIFKADLNPYRKEVFSRNVLQKAQPQKKLWRQRSWLHNIVHFYSQDFADLLLSFFRLAFPVATILAAWPRATFCERGHLSQTTPSQYTCKGSGAHSALWVSQGLSEIFSLVTLEPSKLRCVPASGRAKARSLPLILPLIG